MIFRVCLTLLMVFTVAVASSGQHPHRPASETIERRNDLRRWVMLNADPDRPWNTQVYSKMLGPFEKSRSPEKPVWDVYYFPRADMTNLLARQANVIELWRFGRATE